MTNNSVKYLKYSSIILESFYYSGKSKNVEDNTVVRPRPGIRVQNNRNALRRNVRNVIGKLIV